MYYFYLGVFFINYIDVNIGFRALRSSGEFLSLNVLSVSTFECQMNVGIHSWRLWWVEGGGGEYVNNLGSDLSTSNSWKTFIILRRCMENPRNCKFY